MRNFDLSSNSRKALVKSEKQMQKWKQIKHETKKTEIVEKLGNIEKQEKLWKVGKSSKSKHGHNLVKIN